MQEGKLTPLGGYDVQPSSAWVSLEFSSTTAREEARSSFSREIKHFNVYLTIARDCKFRAKVEHKDKGMEKVEVALLKYIAEYWVCFLMSVNTISLGIKQTKERNCLTFNAAAEKIIAHAGSSLQHHGQRTRTSPRVHFQHHGQRTGAMVKCAFSTTESDTTQDGSVKVGRSRTCFALIQTAASREAKTRRSKVKCLSTSSP